MLAVPVLLDGFAAGLELEAEGSLEVLDIAEAGLHSSPNSVSLQQFRWVGRQNNMAIASHYFADEIAKDCSSLVPSMPFELERHLGSFDP